MVKKTLKKDGKLVNFYVEQKKYAEMQAFAKNNGYSVSDLLRLSVNRIMVNPGLLHTSEETNTLQKNDFREEAGWVREQFSQLAGTLQSMIERQEERALAVEQVSPDQVRYQEVLVKNQPVTLLDALDLLVTEFPEKKEELLEDRPHVDIIHSLGKKVVKLAKPTSDKLIWWPENKKR